jgi:signal transduction histidine kinase
VSLVLIGVLLINYNMRPLYRLLDWIDRYEPGQCSCKIPSDTDIIEFRKLIAAVENAVSRFETQFEERKIFIGNASHELQTPLAVCSNRIEMLLDRADMNEDMAEELVRIHRSLNGLIRLNKTMLLLSKIENGQFPQTNDVNISSLALESIRMYQEIYEHKNLRVDVGQEQEFILKIDEQMASVLVNNLIKNAFAYSPEGGSLTVSSDEHGFTVRNDGQSPLDKDMVFRRFYQPSGRKEGTTGLGLALVYSVCLNNGLDISYDFRDGEHIFAINLKKSK